MQSEIEKFATQKLRQIHALLRSRDRGVIAGALLSFTPVFPACAIGVLVSAVNLVLIGKGRLPRREATLVKASLAAGVLGTILWIYILGQFAESLAVVMVHITDIILRPFGPIDLAPSVREGGYGFDV